MMPRNPTQSVSLAKVLTTASTRSIPAVGERAHAREIESEEQRERQREAEREAERGAEKQRDAGVSGGGGGGKRESKEAEGQTAQR